MNSEPSPAPVEQVAAPQPEALALPSGAQFIDFPVGKYAIPQEDMPEFMSSKYTTQERERIKYMLSLFAQMEAGGIVPTSETLGFQHKALRGYGASNLRTQYYKWVRPGGGWRAIARKFTNGSEPMPKEFIQHFRALCEQNGRSMKQAMKALYRAWYDGRDVPGFGTWREYYGTVRPDEDLPAVCPGIPPGWKKSNLYTFQPTRAARKLKTRGFAAMKAELPSLIRDTGKLLPLQLVVIDDFEIDQKCFVHRDVNGKMVRSICAMAGVVAMDVATRRILGMILKPRLPDDEGKKQAITRAEVRLLLYGVIRDHGIPAHGMTILAEKAAAAVTAELQVTFSNLFGGRVAVTRTSTIDQAVLKSGFPDSGGKPWLKGWIESFFNLMHNVAAGILPGQKGANYLVKPANLEEKLRATQRLIGTGSKDAQLSDEQLARARVPFKTPGELCDVYLKIFQWIEERTDHEMLGFDRVFEFRRPEPMSPWQPWDELALVPEAEQALMIPNDRPESARERWAKLFPAVRTSHVDAAVLMMLLLTPKKAERKSRHLTFDHNKSGYTWEFAADSLIAREIQQGEDVLVYFDPAHADHAHVARLDGRWLGEVRRWGGPTGKVDITSQDEITEAERQLAALYGSVLAEVRSRPLHQLEEAQLAQDKATNAQLVAEAKQSRELGLTATLNRPVPAGVGVVTAAGQQLAAQIARGEQSAAEQRKAERATESEQAAVAKLVDRYADEESTDRYL